MFTIYFQDKAVVFTGPEDPDDAVLPFPVAEGDVEFGTPADWAGGIAKMLQIHENSKLLIYHSTDPESALRSFLDHFEVIGAAGGVVESDTGKVLMIYRNGKWDLPKGHIEPGEIPSVAAVREVGEETGVEVPGAGELITVTRHTYLFGNEWKLKETWWYRMNSPQVVPVPQVEEGIAEVKWVDPGEVDYYTISSYPSIREVVREAGYCR